MSDNRAKKYKLDMGRCCDITELCAIDITSIQVQMDCLKEKIDRLKGLLEEVIEILREIEAEKEAKEE